jgi:hypothetical protein
MDTSKTLPLSRRVVAPNWPETPADVDGRAGLARNWSSLVPIPPEESLIVDDRSAQSPAEAIEGRLMNLLRDESLPVSHLQLKGLVRGRYEA